MQSLWYFIVALLSFLGILSGVILAFISPEELKEGKKYVTWLYHVLLVCIAGVVAYFFSVWAGIFILALLCSYFLLFNRQNNHQRNKMIIYALLGILLYFSSIKQDFFLAVAVLVFIIGLCLGILYTEPYEKNRKFRTSRIMIAAKALLVHLGFMVIAVLLGLLF